MAQADVNGTTLWYETNGAGTPLFLLPGLGLDHRYYRLGEPMLREISTTVLVDPRGIGQAQKDDPKSVT